MGEGVFGIGSVWADGGVSGVVGMSSVLGVIGCAVLGVEVGSVVDMVGGWMVEYCSGDWKAFKMVLF